MTELDFQRLPLYQERSFVPDNADLTDKNQICTLFQQLLDQDILSKEELETWLNNLSEVEAALDQQASILHIRMTCQTDDEQRAEAYKAFIADVVPSVRVLGDKLNRKYADLREKYELDQDRYMVYDRAIKAELDLFREENVPLQTDESLLSQKYQTVCGAMTVHFEGKEQTLQEMQIYLQKTDRGLREKAWRAAAKRRLKDKDELEQIFDNMLALRSQIAENCEYDTYAQYKFKSYHRFDYTIDNCKHYHDAVERLVVPVWRDVLLKRKELLEVDSLRPWDTAVDPLGRDPLHPFAEVSQLIHGCKTMFSQTDDELGSQFTMMTDTGLLDLDSRKGKAPGGYQSTLTEARKPFIFMNAVGLDRDVWTLLHEGGHAFHALACAHDPLYAYRHAPMEFCEVASMGMELLASEELAAFYDEINTKRSRQEHLETIIMVLPWVATIDAFQHWIYEHPEHSPEDRAQAWLAIRERFSGNVVDWSGLEQEQQYLWHRQLHIFEVPFYYIEYGIAQLGALQLWIKARGNHKQALASYRSALALGGSRPLPELFAAAGLEFDFTEKTIAPLIEKVAEELATLQ